MKRVAIHLLAVWVALCCCQWRAIGSVLGMPALPSCCADGPAADASPRDDDRACADDACCAESSCCDDETGDEHDSRPTDGRCAGCCDKGLAPSADELPSSLFDLHLDHLGTLLLHVPSIALPSIDRSIEHGTVWHPPPGRFRPLVCILTV